MKLCTKCKQELPLTDFYIKKGYKGGNMFLQRAFLVAFLVLSGCLPGCKTTPTPNVKVSVTSAKELRVGANLVETFVTISEKAEKEGLQPGSLDAVFLRKGMGVLKRVTGPGANPVAKTDEALHAEELRFQATSDILAENERAIQKALGDKDILIAERDAIILAYENSNIRFSWMILGIAGVVLAGMVALAWGQVGPRTGKIVAGVLGIPYAALIFGMFYEAHATAAIAGGIILLISAIMVIVYGLLFKKKMVTSQKREEVLQVEVEEKLDEPAKLALTTRLKAIK